MIGKTWVVYKDNIKGNMMTSSKGNIFRVTGHLCGEITGHRWIPRIYKGQWRGALMFYLIYAWKNGWVNNREAGDLRRQRAHYDVNVMKNQQWTGFTTNHRSSLPNIQTFKFCCNHEHWWYSCGLCSYWQEVLSFEMFPRQQWFPGQ